MQCLLLSKVLIKSPICFIWWSNGSQLLVISLVCPSQGHTHHHGRLWSRPLAAFSNPAEVQRGPHKNTMVVRLYLHSLSFMGRCSEGQRTEQSEIMRGAQASYSLKLHEDHPECKWRGFEHRDNLVVLIHLINFASKGCYAIQFFVIMLHVKLISLIS